MVEEQPLLLSNCFPHIRELLPAMTTKYGPPNASFKTSHPNEQICEAPRP